MPPDMRIPCSARRGLIPLLLLTLAACAGGRNEAEAPGVAGTWIMRLDGRPFMVLMLQSDDDAVTGSLVRPQPMITDGLTFSKIGQEIVTERLSGTASSDGTLSLVAEDPDRPGESTELEFRLTAPDAAALTLVGAPFDAWPFRRYVGAAAPQVWSGWDPNRSYPIVDPYVPPNPEMAAIYEADQAVRQSIDRFREQSAQIAQEDARRRDQVRALLAAGALRAGEDFRHAALVFQHGEKPEDHLLAHTLALVALSKGDRSAAWIAAASFDAYLLSVGEPQVYGTGFTFEGTSREPFNRTLVSDALRRELGVPPLAEQQEQMKRLLQKDENAPSR